jgi:hypothetical protein
MSVLEGANIILRTPTDEILTKAEIRVAFGYYYYSYRAVMFVSACIRINALLSVFPSFSMTDQLVPRYALRSHA